MQKLLSIVVPFANEERNLVALVQAVSEAMRATSLRHELILVNDGSSDGSFDVVRELSTTHPEIVLVDLSRNFGKELALTAGLDEAKGDAVVFMDADLQHPPSLLPELVRRWESGAEVVVAVRESTENKSTFRTFASKVYHALMKRLGDHGAVAGETDYRLLDRLVCEAAKRVTERRRLFRGVLNWLGFRREYVPFQAGARTDGPPRYTLGKLFNLAIDAFISHTEAPIRLVLYVGLATVILSGGGLFWMQFAFFIDERWYYTPLAKALVFNTGLVGFILFSIGVVGLYVAKIHYEVLGRPAYIVRKVHREVAAAPSAEVVFGDDTLVDRSGSPFQGRRG